MTFVMVDGSHAYIQTQAKEKLAYVFVCFVTIQVDLFLLNS